MVIHVRTVLITGVLLAIWNRRVELEEKSRLGNSFRIYLFWEQRNGEWVGINGQVGKSERQNKWGFWNNIG